MTKQESPSDEKAPNKSPNIRLRDVTPDDIPIFFEYQLDPTANHMVAFTTEDPSNREAFMARWARLLKDDAIIKKTILFEEQIVGHVTSFQQFGQPSVGYWLDKAYWGRGIATHALSEFLRDLKVRPLYGRAAKDNIASIRVLQKCGFTISGYNKAFANARGQEIEEVILKLE